MYLYDTNIKLFTIEKQKRLKKKSGLRTAQSKEFWNGECSVCDILQDADPRAFLRRANSRRNFLLQFPSNEVYFYDINIKLFRIEKQKRLTKKSGLGTAQRERDVDDEDED